MKNIKHLRYKVDNNEKTLNNCRLFGVQNLNPGYNGKELFPSKVPHYIIETDDKKIDFIEVEKVIEIKFEEMVT